MGQQAVLKVKVALSKSLKTYKVQTKKMIPTSIPQAKVGKGAQESFAKQKVVK